MDNEEWLTARETLALAAEQLNSEYVAAEAICSRAHDGLIRARARRFAANDKILDDCKLPKRFWWARGKAALDQNWGTGDFETWLDRRIHLRAYGVEFEAASVLSMLGLSSLPDRPDEQQPAGKGGRPRGEFWEQMLVDTFKAVYDGDFKPKVQADLERSMMDWAISHGHDTSIASVRPRARMIWKAITD
jgi:hypothetical protein